MKRIDGGLVIAFDGPDGAGKTTQLDLAAEYLTGQGYSVWTTRHSGGTQIGERLREVSLSDTPRTAETDVYISMAMGVALSEELQKHRQLGDICLIDRSPLALLAYNGYGSQLDDLKMAENFTKELLVREEIDLLVMFSADQATVAKRMQGRSQTKDYFEKKGEDFFSRVRRGYEIGVATVKEDPNLIKTVVEVDATPAVDVIQKQIREIIDRSLK